MGEEILTYPQNGRTLSYFCDERIQHGFTLVSTHRIVVNRKGWSLLHYVLLLFVIFISALIMVSAAQLLQPFPVIGAFLFYWARRQRVVQEAVVVMPTFGVQLETVYHSKKVRRRFFPLGKILAPVINEAVSPVTCYFYLALLLRGEDNLVLGFLHLRPPLKMLVPIWRSLCEGIEFSVAKPAGQGPEDVPSSSSSKAEDETEITSS